MKFYTNKYPLNYAYNQDTKESVQLPVGSIFTIDGINNDSFDLKCVGKESINNIMVGCNMLKFAFNETDNINL